MEYKKRLVEIQEHIFYNKINYNYLKKELESGVDINDIDPPLLFYGCDINLFFFLLENGADPNSSWGWKDESLKNGNNISAFQSLVSRKCEKSKYNVIKLAIEKGANINFKNNYGKTALDYALTNGDESIVELLKEHGAEVGNFEYNKLIFRGNLEINPFEIEIYFEDKVEIIESFINFGYSLKSIYIESEEKYERTILNYSVYYQSYYRYNKSCNVTELLLKRGADPNYFSSMELPPLHNAIQTIYDNFYSESIPDVDHEGDIITPTPTTVLELLLQYGADINLINKDGYTALDLAVEAQNPWAEELLINNGAKHSDKFMNENDDSSHLSNKQWKLDYLLRYKAQQFIFSNELNQAFKKVRYEGTSLDEINLPEIHRIVLYFNFRCGNFNFGEDKFFQENQKELESKISKLKDINERDKNGLTILDYRVYLNRVIRPLLKFIRENGGKHSLELDYTEDFIGYYDDFYKKNY